MLLLIHFIQNLKTKTSSSFQWKSKYTKTFNLIFFSIKFAKIPHLNKLTQILNIFGLSRLLNIFSGQRLRFPSKLNGDIKLNWRLTQLTQPSLLDLLLCDITSTASSIQYSNPLGKSDHVLIQADFAIWVGEETNTDRPNFKKARYVEMRKSIS